MPGTRVLIVDDDKLTLNTLKDLLKRCGFEVETAEDGMEMFYKSVPGDYDVIVTDMNMPNLSGAGAAQLLTKAGCATPIICITGLSKDQIQDIRSKFRVVLQKPLNVSLLGRIIRKLAVH